MPPPHLLIGALSPPTQVTNVLSTYLQGFRCPPTVCSVQSSPTPPPLSSGPEVQQTQCWPDRGAGTVGERGDPCTDTLIVPHNAHAPTGLPTLKVRAEAPEGHLYPSGLLLGNRWALGLSLTLLSVEQRG